jgi:hypothetical protein
MYGVYSILKEVQIYQNPRKYFASCLCTIRRFPAHLDVMEGELLKEGRFIEFKDGFLTLSHYT